MIKLLIYAVLIYFAYKLFIPKSLRSGPTEYLDQEREDEDYTDYEELD